MSAACPGPSAAGRLSRRHSRSPAMGVDPGVSRRVDPGMGPRRVSSYHSAVAWGPGLAPGTARLYWAGTTTRRCGGDLRVAVAWSDNAGKTWSKLHVFRSTPAWVGGMPDIAVDANPRSPGHGTVWVAYNYPLANRRGSGLRVVASADFGRTWHGTGVPRAAAPAGFNATWRFGYRIRTGPDGTAFVSWYQADLRRWNPGRVFERGPLANVGRIGFAVSRDHLRWHAPADLTDRRSRPPSHGTPGPSGTGQRPGRDTHTYLDPMWSHGLDVDPVGGDVYLAIADDDPRTGRPRRDGAHRAQHRRGTAPGRGRLLTSPRTSRDRRPVRVFGPGVAVRAGVVVVGMRTIDDVAAAPRLAPTPASALRGPFPSTAGERSQRRR